MYNIGQQYPVRNVPITLYWSSDRAAAKNTNGAGWLNEPGDYWILNKRWATSDGRVHTSKPSGTSVSLYGLAKTRGGAAIGWVRDDDNFQLITATSHPSSITTNHTSFNITVTGTPGLYYWITARALDGEVINGRFAIYRLAAGTLASSPQTITLNIDSRTLNRIYELMGNNSVLGLGIEIETLTEPENDQTIIGKTSFSTNISVPTSNNPVIRTAPTINYTNQVGGKSYQGITGISVTANTNNVTYKDKASSSSVEIFIDGVSVRKFTSGTQTSPVRIPNRSGNIPIRVIFTDTRNRSTTWDSSVYFNPYIPVSIDQFVVNRTNSGFSINLSGRYPNQFGTTLRYRIDRKPRGSSYWFSVLGNTSFRGQTNGNYSVTRAFTLGDETAQDIRVTVTDGTGYSAQTTAILGTEAVPLSLGKEGVGVGTVISNAHPANLQVGPGGILLNGTHLTEDLLKGLLAVTFTTKSMDASVSLNAMNTSGIYRLNGKHIGLPHSTPESWGNMLVVGGAPYGDNLSQILFGETYIYMRHKSGYPNYQWGPWYRIQMVRD